MNSRVLTLCPFTFPTSPLPGRVSRPLKPALFPAQPLCSALPAASEPAALCLGRSLSLPPELGSRGPRGRALPLPARSGSGRSRRHQPSNKFPPPGRVCGFEELVPVFLLAFDCFLWFLFPGKEEEKSRALRDRLMAALPSPAHAQRAPRARAYSALLPPFSHSPSVFRF